jgi:hypothetical protein
VDRAAGGSAGRIGKLIPLRRRPKV